jgi:hypothetical protein
VYTYKIYFPKVLRQIEAYKANTQSCNSIVNEWLNTEDYNETDKFLSPSDLIAIMT